MQLTARQSHAHDGLYEWRMSFEGHLAHLGTDSSTGGLPAIQRLNEVPGHHQ